ncbi:hypothetical protein FIBSPDRAFT_877159 [Athelia psychrophila]|uniref:Uncharacterized protein n=1 Tax=Athelia psychrophila TaxID=1759441 RepID=A0A167W7J2_9AGAM|nr:hypothetical protein FIBSPDRAFT_877159 [Fibularhizoctonia sp. CBS 109695]
MLLREINTCLIHRQEQPTPLYSSSPHPPRYHSIYWSPAGHLLPSTLPPPNSARAPGSSPTANQKICSHIAPSHILTA